MTMAAFWSASYAQISSDLANRIPPVTGVDT
jgi:hypothetical protein